MAQHQCQLNFLSRSDGSAFYSVGDTVMLASVHGPGDVKVSNRLFDSLHLDVFFSSRTGTSNITEKAMESFIMKTVKPALLAHLHPRTAITLTVQEFQSAGLVLSASINAVCLALIDAGVAMKSLFAAVTCCLTEDGVCIVEPSEIDLKESTAVITFVFDASELAVLSVYQDGSFKCEQLNSCLLKCKEAAKDVFAFYRRVVEKKYSDFFNLPR